MKPNGVMSMNRINLFEAEHSIDSHARFMKLEFAVLFKERVIIEKFIGMVRGNYIDQIILNWLFFV